ncbi:hypothetical protein tb265_13610 [Gemmatimonadetes bacterium T265]|nr:hypothetical protein tb265_13610 [Gemmatimonadetes bacterium T265]
MLNDEDAPTTDRPDDDAPARYRVWDPAAYRRFVAELDDDLGAAREEGEALADQDRELGWTPSASPMTLWALLADTAGGSDRSRAALVACVSHVTGGPNTMRPLTVVPDPDAALVRALGGTEPADRAAWPQYLISLATEVTEGEGRRLPKGPLAHVRERAAQLIADTEDEIQDALAAAYEEGAIAGAWDDATEAGTRQHEVAAGTDALARAVADARVERAIAIAGANALPILTTGDDPSALVLGRFPTGSAVWRELVRAVVGGEVVPGSTGWRGALWALQVAFVAGTDDVASVRTGSRIVRQAAERAGVAAVVTA